MAGLAIRWRRQLRTFSIHRLVAVLKRKRPRPKLNTFDRLFWTTLRRLWSRWADVLVIAKSETVVGWHRAGPQVSPGEATPKTDWVSV